MQDNNIRRIAIVGGGPSDWMAVGVLAKLIKPEYCQVRLIESEDIVIFVGFLCGAVEAGI